MKLPHKIVLAGRINVGKSTLFNRLSSCVKSITLDYGGVTRDVLYDTLSWKGKTCTIVDTGGIGFEKKDDVIQKVIDKKVEQEFEEAEIIALVCDGQVGITTEDVALAKKIHRYKKPTVLLINKCDTRESQEHRHAFYKLGFADMFAVSAQHGIGIDDLLNWFVEHLPTYTSTQQNNVQYRVVLLGKPNVGKSSLMNLLVKQERSLVTDVPGTTRESVLHQIQWDKQTIEMVDTAGVRRKRSIDKEIEKLMVKNSLCAMKDADIVILVLDGSYGGLTNQELKLADMAFDKGKAVIIANNKNDLVKEDLASSWKESYAEYKHLLDLFATITISCVTGYNVGKVLPLIQEVWQRYQQTFSDAHLSLLLKEALAKKPLFHKQQRLKIFSVHQVKTKPPTLCLTVNEPEWFGKSQRAFLQRILRKRFTLVGVPIKFIVRRISQSRQ